MRCSRAEKLISIHLDGELDPQRDRAVARHLDTCERCQAFARDFGDSWRRLESLCAPRPRADFAAQLLARLPDSRTQTRGLRRVLHTLRPARIGLGIAAFFGGIVVTATLNFAWKTDSAQPVSSLDSFASESFEPFAAGSVEGRLLALLPEREE